MTAKDYCPVLRPTFEEFLHPKEYIKSIEHLVFQHGICKIIPPPSWNPRHSIECLCGPGNFMNACKHKADRDTSENENKNDTQTVPSIQRGPRNDTNRFGTFTNPDNYIKSSNAMTPECLCGLSNIFGDDENDSLFNIHTNHTESCAYINRVYNKNNSNKSDVNVSDNDISDNKNYPKSYNELLNKVDIEKYHRNGYGDDILGKTITQISMDDKNGYIHVYLPYDHLWYEGKIIDINLEMNSCDIELIKLNGSSTNENEIITIYPMEVIVIKLNNYTFECEEYGNNSSTDSMDHENESVLNKYCQPMIGHELQNRLSEINNIQHWRDMGRIPSNIINSYVSMNMTIYEDDNYFNGNDGTPIYEESEYNGEADHSMSDITLTNKSVNETNDKCENLGDMIIKAPIRQNLYQSPNAKGGVYHCVNVVEHERMSVQYFYEKTQKELKTEIKDSKKTKQIMKWIENDLIELHLIEIEREWIRNLTYKHPLYGADSIGSLFHDNQVWNLGNLDSILNLISSHIEGVTIPYLYFGTWRSMFAWHIEDRALWAINYLHFGKPKIWYGIPPKDLQKMEQVMAANFPKDSAYCNVFTRHKSSFIAPKLLMKNGVEIYKAIQRANEIIITAPNAYHAGFNLGFNCAEAVNIATPSWIPHGIVAAHCKCGIMQSSVKFDIESLIQKIQTQYPQLASEIPKLPSNYQKILKQQQSEKKKRNLDCYYVPPKKRQKLSLSQTPTPKHKPKPKKRGRRSSGCGGIRNGIKTRKSDIKKCKNNKCKKEDRELNAKKRRGYGRSRASARRLLKQK